MRDASGGTGEPCRLAPAALAPVRIRGLSACSAVILVTSASRFSLSFSPNILGSSAPDVEWMLHLYKIANHLAFSDLRFRRRLQNSGGQKGTSTSNSLPITSRLPDGLVKGAGFTGPDADMYETALKRSPRQSWSQLGARPAVGARSRRGRRRFAAWWRGDRPPAIPPVRSVPILAAS